MASVEFDHVDKVFPGGTHALVDFTLQVGDGELVVLVGPSGCGKSTVLRLLAGLEEITHGTIRIADRVVNALPPQERNVAMVFQDYALYPFMSVRRNLEFPLKMRKLAREEIDRRVQWAAELLGIGTLLDRLPKQLSGGQRQRVAMGRALVREPAVSLLDEPLSNLDAKLRVQVRAEISDLQQRTKTTMLYVTHDQVEAMTLGHRVAVLKEGRLQQVAPPRELYDHPANVFVAGFIGNPPMNLLPIHAAIDGDQLILSVGDQKVRLRGIVVDDGIRRAIARDQLTAGIRPESLHLATGEGEYLTVVVEHVEYLGHETLAYVRMDHAGNDAVHLVARLEGMRPFRAGERLSLRLDSAAVHVFDADGTAVLSPPSSSTAP